MKGTKDVNICHDSGSQGGLWHLSWILREEKIAQGPMDMEKVDRSQ